ncbi:MAG: hypothetical protein R3Y46_03805 [Opitutales bacterium]
MQEWQELRGDSTPENHSKDKSDRNTFKDIRSNFYGETAGETHDAQHINTPAKIKD